MNIIFIIILLVFIAEKIAGGKKTTGTTADPVAPKIDDPASVRLR
ncbi:hypothetical protein [Niabella drilacis]|uniref:Uncharacterized protein n=1 Tax=Niabella drilacis (strain DSM 25811 / CCM 8410 / CCUG 62505 / LMG 26954 / E90) TaxID=1285928 RepID=A0A1G6JSM7_NIADE|nr:hypothetical protein [Niabella drilacis]SDC21651.1 hypothetical protein SAMN04487894_101625 [Niabella drilacis]